MSNTCPLCNNPLYELDDIFESAPLFSKYVVYSKGDTVYFKGYYWEAKGPVAMIAPLENSIPQTHYWSLACKAEARRVND